jgi:hypothetical protein
MKQKVFKILSKAPLENDEQVSLKRFINYLAERAENEKSFRKRVYQYALQYFKDHPELAEPVSIHRLQDFPELIYLLHDSLLSPLMNEQEALWALSIPNSDTIFYCTDSFYRLMSPNNPNGMYVAATDAERASFQDSLKGMNYALVLERFHQIQSLNKDEIIYVWTDKTTLLPRYFSINIDNRFVDVYKIGPMPDRNEEDMKKKAMEAKNLCQMEGTIPLSSFSFNGFSIVTATDITARYALHKIRSAIIRHTPGDFNHTYNQVIFLLKALCGKNSLQFGLLPFFKVNDRAVSFYGNYTHSIAISTALDQQLDEQLFLNWLNEYFVHPRVIFHYNFNDEELKNNPFFQAFTKAGLQGYGAMPVYHNNELSGILEISTTDIGALDGSLFSKLDTALPILAQLMKNNQAEFEAGIDNVIRTNFTSIQPAVEWKFNDIAWKYIRSKFERALPANLETIRFEHVYPLYGAIDIRNSTIERNEALFKDMQTYFYLLRHTLQSINTDIEEQAQELLTETIDIEKQTSLFISASDETTIIKFMEKAGNILQKIAEEKPEYTSVTDAYFKKLDPEHGEVYRHRRALETTIQMMNSYINQFIELMQTQVQQVYPSYFEKFRTDGIEYDIYIGQSITPEQEYKEEYLSQLRLLQLRSMAAIAKLIHNNKELMPLPLQTTQLIYANANVIDISFRTDEKRFDVEGAYNIRYQIVKKRIDKVHVKDTGERLTQPDKIAIVFSQKEHADEYNEYISLLQQEDILEPSLEYLELEELQGVSGLHALRVSVVL